MAWDMEETATCDECCDRALRDMAESDGWTLNVNEAPKIGAAIDYCPTCAGKLADDEDADEDDDETEVN